MRSLLFTVVFFTFFLFSEAQTISSFSPTSGPVGTLVTINGSSLSAVTSVKVGGVASIIINNKGTSLQVLVMPGAITGAVSITSGTGTVTASGSYTITPSNPPNRQQGSKLVGSGVVPQPTQQGIAVSISGDGNTAIVGGPDDGGGLGCAWIYVKSGTTWTQQGNKLVGTEAISSAKQGSSVSISADGNTVIIGAPYDEYLKGACWIFTRSGTTWTQLGRKLVATDATNDARLGSSVDLSADGNTAIIGGPVDNSGVGAVWIFTKEGTSWMQQGNKLIGADALGGSGQGQSVALSTNGNTAIVGGPGDNNGVGAVWIFTRNGTTWTQQGNKLTGTDASGNARQGSSVSLSADGNTTIVGGSADNNGIGAVWIFTRNGTSWNQQGNKLIGTGAAGNARQGNAVSLSADGNTALIGGSSDNNMIGAAWIFTRSGSTWTQQGSKIVGTGELGSPGQGYAVGITADGNTAILGGPGDNFAIGAAWFFSRSGTTWSQQGNKLVGTGAVGGIYQGYSVGVSADGNTAIVGAPQDNVNTGAAWIFTRTGTSWTQQGSKLVGMGATSQGAAQGYSVALSADGNTAIVGGLLDNLQAGAVWIFTRNGTSWTQQGSKLTGTGTTSGSSLGWSVALSADGNTAIAGGVYDNNQTGAAWIFTRTGTTWAQQGNKLVGTGAIGSYGGGSAQGWSVALSADGNTAIVGGIADNNYIGASWVYTRSGTTWTQQGTKLVAKGICNVMGWSVALSADGNTAIIGGIATDSTNLQSGGAWVFTRTGTSWAQQSNVLVGSDAVGVGEACYVSLSADGNTALISGSGDNLYTGAAWVFTRSGTTWAQQGSKLVGTGAVGNASQGWSVALSADGNTGIIGGNRDNYTTGAIWAFTNCNTTVSTQPSTQPQIICQGASAAPLSISATAGSGITLSYQWYSNTANSTASGTPIAGATAASYTPLTNTLGTYYYYAVVTSSTNCVAVSNCAGAFTVAAPNTLELSSAAGTNNQTLCINTAIKPITYSTTGATGASFTGLPNGVTGSFISNTVSLSGTPTASGNFSYTITLTGGCGTVTASGTINVTPANTLTLTSAAGTVAQTLCVSNSITAITYATTGATGATFSGLPGGVTGSFTANTVTVSGTPGATGSFNYTIVLTGGCGTVTASGSLTVNPNPAPPIITSKNATTFCQGGADTLVSSAPTGNQWYFNSTAISGATAPSYVVTIAGFYSVTFTNTNGCKASSSIVPIVVNSLPAKPLINWNGTQFSTATTGVTYQWWLNNTPVNGATAATHKPTQTGSYKLQVTDNNGCTNSSDSFKLVVTGVNNLADIPSSHIAKVYPKPAVSLLMVEFPQALNQQLLLELVNQYGQVVKRVQTTHQLTAIAVHQLASGSYVLQIIGKGYAQTQQLLILK